MMSPLIDGTKLIIQLLIITSFIFGKSELLIEVMHK